MRADVWLAQGPFGAGKVLISHVGREPEDAPCAGIADAAPEVLVLGQPLVQALDRVGGLREHGEALEVVAPLDHQLEVHLAARPERLQPLQDAVQATQADDHLGREGRKEESSG